MLESQPSVKFKWDQSQRVCGGIERILNLFRKEGGSYYYCTERPPQRNFLSIWRQNIPTNIHSYVRPSYSSRLGPVRSAKMALQGFPIIALVVVVVVVADVSCGVVLLVSTKSANSKLMCNTTEALTLRWCCSYCCGYRSDRWFLLPRMR